MAIKKILFGVLVLTIIFWPFLFGFGLVAGILSISGSEEEQSEALKYHWGKEDSSHQLLSIPIYGPILDDRPEFGSFDPFLSTFASYGTFIKDELYKAAENSSIDGVILEINSPGGTVTGSKAIADGVTYYREKTGKPVYAFASGLMASGGYWSGSSADQIIVETGSLVGSIGVVGAQFPTYNNVVELNQGILGGGVTTTGGIEVTTITAGEGKDFGNPYRNPTEKELALAQESTDQAYDAFVNFVSSRRNLENQYVVSSIGAYVYGEEQALSLGLIDAIGNRELAYQKLADHLELGNDFKIVRSLQQEGFFASLLGVVSKINQPESNTLTSASLSSCFYAHRVMAYHGNVVDLCN